MTAGTYSTSPIIAAGSLEVKTTDQQFALGMTVPIVSDNIPSRIGKFAMYIRASGVIGNSSYCTVDLTTVSCLATSVDGGAGTGYFRNGSTAFAANEYGWVFCVKTAIPQ
jgi:hypothetical protein